jgi:hypothetical protein
MIQRLQVFWISPKSAVSFETITHFAGRQRDGSRWELPADEALEAVRDGSLSLYLIRKGIVHDIVAAYHDGLHYLKCADDELSPALLLALPSFEPQQGSSV